MKETTKPIHKYKAWQILGYSGGIPFCLFIAMSLYPSHYFDFNAQQAFVFYSAMILSFMSGSLWSITVKHSSEAESAALATNMESNPVIKIMSNIFFIYAFICLLMPIYNSLVFLFLGYIGLLLTEYLMGYVTEKVYTKAYFKMRVILTLAVVIFHFYAIYVWYLL